MVIELTKFKKKSIERNNKYIETLSNVNEKYSYEFNFDFNEVKYYFDENILSIVMPLSKRIKYDNIILNYIN